MSTALFLFGTDHKYQCGGRDCSSEEALLFASEVNLICRNHGIRRIVEEMSVDGRSNYQVEETIACRVARELSIQHHDVDLARDERAFLSLGDAAVLNAKSAFRSNDGGGKLRAKFDVLVDQTRERIWAARIMNSNLWPVLFILGADHVKTFRGVWKRLGGGIAVIHEEYVPSKL